MGGLRVSDRVKLKTGVEIMEILKFEAGEAVCMWQGSKDTETDHFKIADLEKIADSARPKKSA